MTHLKKFFMSECINRFVFSSVNRNFMLTLQLVLIHYRYADKFSSFGTYTRPG